MSIQTASPGGESGDILSVTTTRLLSYGEKYTAVSSPHTPLPKQLAQAGDEYPPGIVSRYLQLPAKVPWRVRQLSYSVTSDSETPYDKVRDVVDYLARFTYTEQCTAPEENRDGVHHFLFLERQGNCTNFASAAVVMLRVSRVPSRLAVGYISQEWDLDEGKATLRVRDSHARPEVYFPGHGWIGFEATPGFAATPGATEIDFPVESAGAMSLPDSSQEQAPGDAGGSADEASADEGPDEAAQTTPAGASEESGAPAPVDGGTDGSVAQGQGGIGWFPGLLLVVALCAVVILLSARVVLRGWPGRLLWGSRTDWAYASMCLLGSLVGVRPGKAQTPLEYSAALARVFPRLSDDILAIGNAYALSRFSPGRNAGTARGRALRRSRPSSLPCHRRR